jgi:hypothetical protein
MKDLAMAYLIHMDMNRLETLEDPLPGIEAEAHEALKLHSDQAPVMHRLHSFGMPRRRREKPGCALAALAADWGNRHLPPMPDQPWQALLL